MSRASRTNLTDAAGRLRALVLARPDGAFLGNEEALERELGVSKPTVRQAARMLEREGLLQVRRGSAGGYFGARPDATFIEATVATYLEVLAASPQDLTRVATALWLETVRAAADPAAVVDGWAEAAARLRRSITRLADGATFSEVQTVEHAVRRAVFDRVGTPYVELLFNINANYARRTLPATPEGGEADRAFLGAWRKATLLLLDAIADADPEVAVIAARRARACIHERLWPATGAV